MNNPMKNRRIMRHQIFRRILTFTMPAFTSPVAGGAELTLVNGQEHEQPCGKVRFNFSPGSTSVGQDIDFSAIKKTGIIMPDGLPVIPTAIRRTAKAIIAVMPCPIQQFAEATVSVTFQVTRFRRGKDLIEIEAFNLLSVTVNKN